ncbi:IclR family transcriptional regulator [Neobacillus cucumis]|uniref:IclR family transcriptional regulator n=1 Tax=Neobacillus cucumis TaxID=1740721 RepID=UPI00203B7011|nr:IclR family transcriptional regulator [Neobacillus cucumis]MCM3729357.1 IclR family transcriptional regulator [Neobacillus cucumis]
MRKDEQLKTSSTLERALLVLEFLSHAGGKVGVKELSESVQLPKSTTHRILDTLMQAGFVEQDPTSEKYSIGLKAIEIGMSGLKNVDLVDASIPHLRELSTLTKQTSFLAVYNEGEIVYIYKVEGTSSVITNANLGTRNPLHCTGLGKAILAFFPLEEIEMVIDQKGLKRYTDTTITNNEQFLEELSKIRKSGIALNYEEYDEGLSSIAVPIFNYTGQVVAAISVAGPTNRILEEQESISQLLKEKSTHISRRLGYVSAIRSNRF